MKGILVVLLIIVSICFYVFFKAKGREDRPVVQTVEEIEGLFPKTKEGIERLTTKTIDETSARLQTILALQDTQRTFDNTMRAFDRAVERFHITSSILQLLSLVSPDEQIRTSSQNELVRIGAFSVEHLLLNPALFAAFCAYEKHLQDPAFCAQECLNDEERYFVKETLHAYRRAGLQLPAEQQELMKKIKNEISERTIAFEKNIAESNRSIAVTKEQLKGLDDAFINSLKKNAEGLYVVGTDYPTYTRVMEECEVSETRKALSKQFSQRGYPGNEKLLTEIIRLRDELAHILGFRSYAAYEIDAEMASTPERVETFLADMIKRARLKSAQEVELLKKDLPPTVTLTSKGQFQPWDLAYVANYYKKKNLKVDENLISQYFPLDYTLPALLGIYEKFFGLSFKKIDARSLWHPDVQLLAVYKKGEYIGSVLLDLFPRPNKFTHAAQLVVVPAVCEKNGCLYPSVVFVVANFPHGQPGSPALLKRQDVITFFHEFGHAIHSLLSRTQLASFSGTNVKTDFVETPSQALELWMDDAEILKLVSSHVTTKDPLPDDLICCIKALKNFDSGDHTLRQLMYGTASLSYFGPGADKDPYALWKQYSQEFRKHVQFDPDNHGYASFGHLTNYGSKYYGYLWSKVFAVDLFYYIKPYGLLNPTIGDRYAREVLSRGGSKEPMDLLRAFLGREPNSDAFFKDLGLEEQ